MPTLDPAPRSWPPCEISPSACYAWPASSKSPEPCNTSPPTEPESSPSWQPRPAQTDFDVPLLYRQTEHDDPSRSGGDPQLVGNVRGRSMRMLLLGAQASCLTADYWSQKPGIWLARYCRSALESPSVAPGRGQISGGVSTGTTHDQLRRRRPALGNGLGRRDIAVTRAGPARQARCQRTVRPSARLTRDRLPTRRDDHASRIDQLKMTYQCSSVEGHGRGKEYRGDR